MATNTTNSKITPKPNPLGYFSSYTYQISLYMISGEAYNTFTKSNRTDINIPGVYLVAQSGGVNNSKFQRPPGFEFDYYIDNLIMNHELAGPATNSGSPSHTMSFDIIEPYGFSFVTKLDQAFQSFSGYVPQGEKNLSRQYFILGVRFLGYDASGNIVNNNYDLDPLTASSVSAGPNSGIMERFYDICITSLKFRLSGGPVTYKIEASPISQTVAQGVFHGQIPSHVKAVGKTVDEVLNGPQGLMTKLNDMQKELSERKNSAGNPQIEVPDVYAVEYGGSESDIDAIKNAKIVLDSDTDKRMMPMTKVNNVDQSNASSAAGVDADINQRQLTLPGGISITQSIIDIVSRSSYIADTLNVQIKNTTDQSDNGQPEEETNPNPKTSRWFQITPKVEWIKFDNSRQANAYKITYVISPYDTPKVNSSFVEKPTPYYGPHKRYEYWFTGKNSEIIRLDVNFDQLYFDIMTSGGGDTRSSAPQTPLGKPGQSGPGKQVGINIGAASYKTSLDSVAAWTKVQLQILGDPDFLVIPAIPLPTGSVGSNDKRYMSDGRTINPIGGQVFIELNFNEGIDYDYKTQDNGMSGQMNINRNILFISSRDKNSSITQQVSEEAGGGISFQLSTINSVFNKGKFEQSLTLLLNEASKKYTVESSDNSDDNQRPNETNRFNRPAAPISDPNGTGATNSNEYASPEENNSTGLVRDTPVSGKNGITPRVVSNDLPDYSEFTYYSPEEISGRP